METPDDTVNLDDELEILEVGMQKCSEDKEMEAESEEDGILLSRSSAWWSNYR
jgi:hypothetical protein